MDDRVLLFSGFYGVRSSDGKRILVKAPEGQIVEGRNPGPFGLSIGNSPVFRVLNLGDGRYVLQYGPDQIPITLYYQNQLEGLALESFEGPFVSDTGIMPVGGNQGAYPTLFPPTTAQPVTALPGYAPPPSQQSIVEQAIRDRAALEALTKANAAVGIQRDFTPLEMRNPIDTSLPGPVNAPAPAQANWQAISEPGRSTAEVFYMQSAPGGAIVDTTSQRPEMPTGISPIAVAGAMVLLFLLGDDKE